MIFLCWHHVCIFKYEHLMHELCSHTGQECAKCAKTLARKPIAGFLTINATNITDYPALDSESG